MRFRRLIKFAPLVALFLAGGSLQNCTPATQTGPIPKASRTGSDGTNELNGNQTTTSEKDDSETERPSVSAFMLDDDSMAVVQLAVGLQQYLKSETPMVTYKRPKLSDYVEIIRCNTNAVLAGGVTPISLSDLASSNMSQSQKSSLYRSNDFFKVAIQDPKNCQQITTGVSEETFGDAWAPSGSYRWLVRACVDPGRLTDQAALTSRNCSRQIAVSKELPNYQNQRKEDELAATRNIAGYSSKIDQLAAAFQAKVKAYNQAIQTCEDRTHDQQVARKKREAYALIAAVGVELADEVRNGGLKNMFSGPFGFVNEVFQMSQASGMTGPAFQQIVASSNDIPRTCTESLDLDGQMKAVVQGLIDANVNYHNALDQLAKIQAGEAINAGNQNVQIPTGSSVGVDPGASAPNPGTGGGT